MHRSHSPKAWRRHGRDALQVAALALALAVLPACGGGGGGAVNGPDPDVEPDPVPVVDTTPVSRQDPGSVLPAHWRQGAFMQIFVRSYQDSDGDGVGDLRGLTQRLDYLKDLGVTGLWLMPVTASQDRDHGYAVTDYRDIEPAYGSLADFDELLRQAHARGIGVVIDYVVNHSAAQHPLFVSSRSGASSAYRSWYVWQDLKPAGWSVFGGDPWRLNPGAGWYYAAFWDQMPDFNLRHPAAVAWHHDNLRFWLNRGVDGFRLDAVGQLFENGPSAWADQPENLQLLRDMRSTVAGYASRYLVCEGPGAPQAYGPACGSAFAFGHHERVLRAAQGDAAAVATVARYFETAQLSMATLLSNHDSFAGQRVADQLGGNLARMKLAAATTLLMPGTPFIYYGEEIGMRGAATLSGDPKLRTPMSWTADARTAGFTTGTPYRALAANAGSANVQAQQADPGSLLAHYKAMLALRSGLPALARGSYEAARTDGLVMSFHRLLDGQRAVVAVNYGNAEGRAALSGLPPLGTLESRHPIGAGEVAVDAAGQATLPVPPLSVRVLSLR